MRDDDFFWEGARDGKLLIQACGACGLARHPPAPMCSHCRSVLVEVRECSGKAKVTDWFSSKHPTRKDEEERIVARLELDEGVFLISNLHDVALDQIHVGMRVEVFFQGLDGRILPQFRPAAAVAA